MGLRMTGQLEYAFEELPLIVQDGFEAGLVNGEAEISFHADGEFFVGRIWLDGHRRRPVADVMRECFANIAANDSAATVPSMYERKPVEIERGSWLYNAIHEQLENGTFKDNVKNCVAAELAEISPPPSISEHSTLHRAAQGV